MGASVGAVLEGEVVGVGSLGVVLGLAVVLGDVVVGDVVLVGEVLGEGVPDVDGLCDG